MNKERKLIIAANWKMNKTVAEATELVEALKRDLGGQTEVDVVICPPFTALSAVSEVLKDSPIRLGAQNMSEQSYGAFTGEIAAGMLRDLLVHYVILGHSERREYHKEFDALVNAKAKAALEAGLKPIVCVGETLAQREDGQTEKIVGEQIAGSLEGLDAGQFVPFQKLQARAAARAHKTDLFGQAVLVQRLHAVASADDADGARVGGGGHRFGHGQRALGKSGIFKNSHRAVPQNCF